MRLFFVGKTSLKHHITTFTVSRSILQHIVVSMLQYDLLDHTKSSFYMVSFWSAPIWLFSRLKRGIQARWTKKGMRTVEEYEGLLGLIMYVSTWKKGLLKSCPNLSSLISSFMMKCTSKINIGMPWLQNLSFFTFIRYIHQFLGG